MPKPPPLGDPVDSDPTPSQHPHPKVKEEEKEVQVTPDTEPSGNTYLGPVVPNTQ